MSPAKACKVIMVCCWLHNKAVEFGYDLEDEKDKNQPELIREPRSDDTTERAKQSIGKAARAQIVKDFFGGL